MATMELFRAEVERDMNRVKNCLISSGEDERLSLDWDAYLSECSDVDQPKGINEFQPLVGRGLYYHQLLNWLKHFPQQQIHIISSDDLRATPAEVLNSVAAFLGVNALFYSHDQPFLQEEKNVGGTTFKSSQQGTLPSDEPTSRKKEPIPAELEEQLYSFFQPHNQLLYKTIGRDLKWARKST